MVSVRFDRQRGSLSSLRVTGLCDAMWVADCGLSSQENANGILRNASNSVTVLLVQRSQFMGDGAPLLNGRHRS